jgi:hypothetical protein
MKAALLLTVTVTACQLALANDITFTNRTATFTTLEGQTYRVQLVRGDLDGLIWRDGASGGRICYTNLAPDLLESFGISSNRIEVARARAEKKAIADARYRAQPIAEARARSQPQATWTNATPSRPSSDASSLGYVSNGLDARYSPDYMYPYLPFFYGPIGPPAPSAPSAATAPTAGSALNGGTAPTAGFVPSATPAANPAPAPNAGRAVSAPSAPQAFSPPPMPSRRH